MNSNLVLSAALRNLSKAYNYHLAGDPAPDLMVDSIYAVALREYRRDHPNASEYEAYEAIGHRLAKGAE